MQLACLRKVFLESSETIVTVLYAPILRLIYNGQMRLTFLRSKYMVYKETGYLEYIL